MSSSETQLKLVSTLSETRTGYFPITSISYKMLKDSFGSLCYIFLARTIQFSFF